MSRFFFLPSLTALSFLFAGVALVMPSVISAHCDSYLGPVIIAAKQALEKGDVVSVLKWVQKEDEAKITEAFEKTMAVRVKGPEAKELADNYFFETIVRIHRAGESAPYTGLKTGPAEPIVAMSDKSVEKGNIDSLANTLSTHLKKEIKDRFSKVLALKKEADKSVDAGREYVKSYVIYTHYIEGIHRAIMSMNQPHREGKKEQVDKHQH